MKSVTPFVVVSFLLVTAILSAQAPKRNLLSGPTLHGTDTVVLNGKVTSEDNVPPATTVEVVLECLGTRTAQASTDAHGNFSMSVRRSSHSDMSDSTNLRGSSTDLTGCEISAFLAGYSATPLRLMGGGTDIGAIDAGTILLHPTEAKTFAISVISLAAPEKAKSAFEKGEAQKKKGKWAAAVESFRKAIAVYPRYGLAWLELGRVQATQHNFVDAQQSFRQSVTEDSKLAEGYVELAHLAAQQGEWHELLSASDHLVQTHPQTPEFWFWNSAANFNLGNVKEAEASITRGLRVDSAHRVPQMEYLYALVLARRQQFQSAADHTAAYLKLLPQATDAAEAQKRLAEFQSLAAVTAAK